jgi:protein subunit release factor B
MDDKWNHIAERMGRLLIAEGDLIEKFILGSGKGGQKVNKTSSCVYLKHGPSGIEVKCQKTRSRDLNRLYARRELCDRIEERVFKEKSAKQMEREKVRRQKRRRSRRSKEKMLADKKNVSFKKELRRPPSE